MSNRDSMGFGDLIPQDVVDIFAQEKHGNGRKKRTRSLGRALGWLKGKKRKGLDAKGQGLGLGPALDLALDGHPAGHQGGHKGGQKSGKQAHPQGNGHAVPKRDDDDKTTAPPLLQENVFIEASPTRYLENLHTEAREGLKMMQQEETNYGVEFQDNESTVSTMSVHTDGEGFMSDSTLADTTSVVSVQSSVSTRSSRSGLTRQESTFRPLTSGKKTKTKRRHRKTVGGIPQHVQRELGLDRAAWSVTQKFDEEQLYNGDTENSPTTTDGPQQGAGTSLQKRNAVHPLNKDQLDQLSASHRDDLHHLGTDLSDEQRSQSLVVPWMNTAEDLPSPVISMSPQAPYMSKIIPNAVLRPSIDVVEISRGRSRNSVRTVSKSSLVLSSPSPSRASSRASSSRTTSSRSSNITSASRQNPPNVSDSSCWSNSDSSETLVSDSSTISRSSTPRQKRLQDGDVSAKEDKISVHSSNSKASNGRLVVKGDEAKKDGPFGRSLSVMKSKKAPPPPSRSYSLHSKMKRRSRDLTEVRVNSGEENEKNKPGSSPVPSKAIDSPGYHADTSSLDDSAGSGSFSPIRSQQQAQKAEGAVSKEKQKPHQEIKLSKTVSPSSGQDGTSTQVSKQPHKRGILAKLQRLFPGSAPAASTASPLPQPKDLKPDTAVDTVDTVNVSPSVRALRELFNIPPPPKVHAPPPPPPEVWAHSKRSVELLLGPPAPDNLQAIIKKNPKDRRQQRQSPSASTEGSVKSLVVERKHNNPAVTVESVNGSVHVLETKKVQESVILSDGLAEQNVDLKGNSDVTEKVEKVKVSNIISVMLAKAVERREGRLEAVREEEEVKKASIQAAEVTLPAISLVRMPPSPSPALVHHPPQQTTSPESSWPPPPPPMAQAGVNGTDGNDLPLPPPPMFGEVGLVLPVQVPPESSVPGGDSSCTATSVTSVVKIEAEPLNIPPPPPYMAPPPPAKVVSPPTTKKVPPPPPPKEVSPPPPPKKVSLPSLIVVSPPPPKDVSPLPPRKEVSPPPPIVVSPPPPKEVPPPPPIVVSPPPPPKEVSPPPPTVVSPPPPPKEVSPPPPDEIPPSPPKEVSPPPPTVVSPPPPPKEVSPPPPDVIPPPPPKEIPPSPPKEVSPLPPKEILPSPPKEVSPPPPEEIPPSPPKEVSPPPPKEIPPSPPKEVSPPPPKEIPPSPPKEVSPPPPKEIPPSPPKEVSPVRPKESFPLVNDISVTLVTVVSPPPVKEVSPPLVIEVTPLPPKEVSALSTEEVSPPSSQENACQSSGEATPVSHFAPPQSIPPPPPLSSQPKSSEQEIDPPQESIPPESESNLTSDSIVAPPQSIPPPPPVQLVLQPQVVSQTTDGPASQEPSPSPPSEVSIPPALENSPTPEKAQEPAPLPPPLPVQGVADIKDQPSPASTENQTLEQTSVPVVQEEPTPTPTLLQMVMLRSVRSSPEPPKAQDPPEAEVTMRKQQPSNPVSTTSANGEVPQKPIRRSLILLSPTSPTSTSPPPTSPPATVTEQPALPMSQSVLVLPSSPVASPTKKSPPAMTASPSMNLQEAIRLRTAARSKAGPPTRLSLHSPTSPIDLHRSPTSTASFIFSKSNKRVVIETKPAPETVEKKLEVSPVTKVASEAEWVKKMPPPVAKKPKKGKEIETSEGTEQTAGQEALQESIMDAAEKTNGTAGTVEGGAAPST
ncbi:uncharacterized protein KIAA1522-like isoform X4 [Sebastes umbrosus]|uniref:uncharacterized protein KIAA1522-like isoform X4 n=1 Tax=Sebastes umbrosus TaxID=72105 RepID=UPI00189ECBD8|nr:uncharacterized protein KIAA1522-like isoform X4 [Sebastes umbrosus]